MPSISAWSSSAGQEGVPHDFEALEHGQFIFSLIFIKGNYFVHGCHGGLGNTGIREPG